MHIHKTDFVHDPHARGGSPEVEIGIPFLGYGHCNMHDMPLSSQTSACVSYVDHFDQSNLTEPCKQFFESRLRNVVRDTSDEPLYCFAEPRKPKTYDSEDVQKHVIGTHGS